MNTLKNLLQPFLFLARIAIWLISRIWTLLRSFTVLQTIIVSFSPVTGIEENVIKKKLFFMHTIYTFFFFFNIRRSKKVAIEVKKD